jgi:hypothetical protein
MDYVTSEQAFVDAAASHSNKNYPGTVAENKRIIEELIQYCLRRQMLPVVYTPPQHRLYREHFSPRMLNEWKAYGEGLRERYPIARINDFEMDFDKKYYYDGSHLNHAGHELYCAMLEEKMKRILYNLDLDR